MIDRDLTFLQEVRQEKEYVYRYYSYEGEISEFWHRRADGSCYHQEYIRKELARGKKWNKMKIRERTKLEPDKF